MNTVQISVEYDMFIDEVCDCLLTTDNIAHRMDMFQKHIIGMKEREGVEKLSRTIKEIIFNCENKNLDGESLLKLLLNIGTKPEDVSSPDAKFQQPLKFENCNDFTVHGDNIKKNDDESLRNENKKLTTELHELEKKLQLLESENKRLRSDNENLLCKNDSVSRVAQGEIHRLKKLHEEEVLIFENQLYAEQEASKNTKILIVKLEKKVENLQRDYKLKIENLNDKVKGLETKLVDLGSNIQSNQELRERVHETDMGNVRQENKDKLNRAEAEAISSKERIEELEDIIKNLNEEKNLMEMEYSTAKLVWDETVHNNKNEIQNLKKMLKEREETTGIPESRDPAVK